MCIKSMSEHCLIKKNTPELRKKLEDAGLSDEFSKSTESS